jgi:hypothetical protein
MSASLRKQPNCCAAGAQPVWKLKIPKLDEKDILVFDLEIEWACNASTSTGLE